MNDVNDLVDIAGDAFQGGIDIIRHPPGYRSTEQARKKEDSQHKA